MKKCPYLNNDCIGEECALYTKIRGRHPQSGEEIDTPGCSIAFLPVLLLNNTQQVMQTGAANEDLRNKINKANELSQESINSLIDSQDKTREVIKLAANALTAKSLPPG